MIGFPRTYFRWREPKRHSKRAAFVLRNRLLRLLLVIVISSALFLVVLVQFYPIQVVKALVALALIVLFVIAIYYVHAKVPPFVVVGSTHIYRGLNDETADEWKYKNIVHCAFSTKVVDGTTYNTLEIATKKGDRSVVLIPPTVAIDALRSFLATKGVAVHDGPGGRRS